MAADGGSVADDTAGGAPRGPAGDPGAGAIGDAAAGVRLRPTVSAVRRFVAGRRARASTSPQPRGLAVAAAEAAVLLINPRSGGGKAERDERRQLLADQQWRTVQDEEQQNERLLRMSAEILQLAKAIHERSPARVAAGRPESGGGE